MAALQKADGAKVCSLMTPQAQRFTVIASHISVVESELDRERSSCQDISPDAGDGFSATPSVRVTGQRAVATFRPERAPSGFLPGRSILVQLVHSHGRWLVNDPAARPHFPVLPTAEKRCMASWNRAVRRGLRPRPAQGPLAASAVWASVESPSPGARYCVMTVKIPGGFRHFDNHAGRWRLIDAFGVLPRRNVWMKSDSTVISLGEHEPAIGDG